MKKNLTEKWKGLLDAENEATGITAIKEHRKRQLVASLIENQDKDIREDTVYRDKEILENFSGFLNDAPVVLGEAEIGGDHGYNADNIAKGVNTGAVTNAGPAVMGLMRRAVPLLMAFDIAGFQPMKQSTSQYFTLRTMYGKDPLTSTKEAMHPMFAPDSMYSGEGASKKFKVLSTAPIADAEIVEFFHPESGTSFYQNVAGKSLTPVGANADELAVWVNDNAKKGDIAELSMAMATSVAELQEGFNGSDDNAWNEMSFRIDKQVIEARSRQLKAQYSLELAQDLRNVHGISADAELAGILSTEIMLEINRELINWINYTAQIGKTGLTLTVGAKAGVFDFQDPIDVRGARWAGESYKALFIQIDKEANEIARQTGRGAGNFIIASRNVVSALSHVDSNITPASQGLQHGLNVDTTKSVFAGVLGGRYKVYIDQYARQDYFTVGYKGDSEMDAGIYYCPYVALTPLRGADPKNFQPVMGFKTRYGIGLNPFADSRSQSAQKLANGMPSPEAQGKNAYFRKVYVVGL